MKTNEEIIKDTEELLENNPQWIENYTGYANDIL